MRRATFAVAAALLAAPATAMAAGQYYVTDGDAAGKVERWVTGLGGVLQVSGDTPVATGPTDTGLDQLAPNAAGNGLLVGQVASDSNTGLRTYAMSNSGVLSGGVFDLRDTTPVGVAAHPTLPVVYAVFGGGTPTVEWQTVAGSSLSGGSETLVEPLTDDFTATDPQDIVVNPRGTRLYAAFAEGIYTFALNPDGSIGPYELITPIGDVQTMAMTPAGDRMLMATDSDPYDFYKYEVGPDGYLVGAESLDIGQPPGKIAVSPDGAWSYVPRIDGSVLPVRTFDAEPGTPITNIDSPNPIGAAVSPDGGSLHVTSTDGIHTYARASDGSLSTPSLVPNSNLNANPIEIVSRPNAGPTASFTTAPASSGSPTAFDARGSTDPDGSVARYDWDFGDGTSLPNGGPTPTHVYASPGNYTARVTVTDDLGARGFNIHNGHYTVHRGSPASATRQVSVAQGPTVSPPVPNESVQVAEDAGVVLVKVPGSGRYVPLEGLTNIPEGSLIDARKGRVLLVSAANSSGAKQSAVFYKGIFRVDYTRSTLTGKPNGRKVLITQALLRGPVGPCARAKKGDASSSARRRKRRLFGNGKGRFRTRGNHGAATVRGTIWWVADSCEGTRFGVPRGTVYVRDYRKARSLVLRTGKRYLAAAPGSR